MRILLLSTTNLEHGKDNIYSIPIHIIGVGKVGSCFHTEVSVAKYNPDLVITLVLVAG